MTNVTNHPVNASQTEGDVMMKTTETCNTKGSHSAFMTQWQSGCSPQPEFQEALDEDIEVRTESIQRELAYRVADQGDLEAAQQGLVREVVSAHYATGDRDQRQMQVKIVALSVGLQVDSSDQPSFKTQSASVPDYNKRLACAMAKLWLVRELEILQQKTAIEYEELKQVYQQTREQLNSCAETEKADLQCASNSMEPFLAETWNGIGYVENDILNALGMTFERVFEPREDVSSADTLECVFSDSTSLCS